MSWNSCVEASIRNVKQGVGWKSVALRRVCLNFWSFVVILGVTCLFKFRDRHIRIFGQPCQCDSIGCPYCVYGGWRPAEMTGVPAFNTSPTSPNLPNRSIVSLLQWRMVQRKPYHSSCTSTNHAKTQDHQLCDRKLQRGAHKTGAKSAFLSERTFPNSWSMNMVKCLKNLGLQPTLQY